MKVYHKVSGEEIDRDPADCNELCASGAWQRTPVEVDADSPAVAADPASAAPVAETKAEKKAREKAEAEAAKGNAAAPWAAA